MGDHQRRWLAACGVCMSLAVTLMAGCTSEPAASPATTTAATTGAPTTTPEASFTSSVYGLSGPIPGDWLVQPASQRWAGEDIDHTAAYADVLYGDESTVFALGEATEKSREDYATAHSAWLQAARGCPAPSATTDLRIGQDPAVGLVFHCPDGPYGKTLVLKAIATKDGQALIVTQFTPDVDEATDRAQFADLVANWTWQPTQ